MIISNFNGGFQENKLFNSLGYRLALSMNLKDSMLLYINTVLIRIEWPAVITIMRSPRSASDQKSLNKPPFLPGMVPYPGTW